MCISTFFPTVSHFLCFPLSEIICFIWSIIVYSSQRTELFPRADHMILSCAMKLFSYWSVTPLFFCCFTDWGLEGKVIYSVHFLYVVIIVQPPPPPSFPLFLLVMTLALLRWTGGEAKEITVPNHLNNVSECVAFWTMRHHMMWWVEKKSQSPSTVSLRHILSRLFSSPLCTMSVNDFFTSF